MTRQEHLDWCKTRAIELINIGRINEGLTSMMSDLGKHEETRNHLGIQLTVMGMMGGWFDTSEAAIKHIKGFN